jgi:hypothetical protein
MQGKQGARLGLALVTALIVGGGVFGLATSFRTTSSTLGSTAQLVSSCQNDPIDVSYQLVGTDEVNGVVLHNIDTASCNGGTLQVSVTDQDAQVLADATEVVGSSGTTFTIPIQPTKAANVFGVHVSIAS